MVNKDYVLDKMKEIGLQAAEALQAKAHELDGTSLIANENDIPDFNPNVQYLNWSVGTCVRDDGQVWQLIAPYDSITYKDRPADLRAQWALCHTKDPERAKQYVAPYGTSGLYMEGECCIDDGRVYRSTVDNNSWKPDEYLQSWEEVITDEKENKY